MDHSDKVSCVSVGLNEEIWFFFPFPRAPPWLSSGKGTFIPAYVSWSYVGHIVATVSDKSPTTHCQGHCSLSRASLARQLCCTARCQGGQLASRRTARGYLEVGSGVRRRPDMAES
ncbi:hypothetical protein BHM03_00048663 [Ensete ventricosum]|nr:hypothetical protein BHM03_00048663 [Ensete ventricosum]